MKYCPSCGKAGVEGMKFCPRCGQRLMDSDSQEKQRYVRQPEVPLKESNWFERHLNWTLLLGIVGGPFLLFWIFYGVVNLVALFSVNVAAWIFRIAVPGLPMLFILVIVFVVRWYKEKKRQRRTIADCDKAITLNPSNADNHYKRGCGYAGMGEDEKAIADYSKAIELTPNHADAYYSRGLAYRREGEVAKAVSDLEKCIGLSTDLELTKDAQQVLSEIKNSP